jgi:glutamate carboxypeptidase
MSTGMDFSELANLMNINSYTKNKQGVDQSGLLFQQWMEDIGYDTRTYQRETIGNHLLFTSAKSAGKKLLLLGHLDTVFPPMSFETFSEDDQWIYGPGACDIKGGNYVALCALRAVKASSGSIGNIDMLLVSDEETGSDDSKLISHELANDYDYVMVFEAAGKNNELVIGRKGVGTFFIDIEGKAAHAGNHYIDGVNANLEAAHKCIQLTALTQLDKGTTINVGKMEGGIGANTISPHARLIVEMRYTDATERDRVLDAIHSIVHSHEIEGIEATLSGGIQRDVMQPNNEQLVFLRELESITGEPFLTEQRGGVSDANIFAAKGCVTLDGFGPFGDGDHTIHERASKHSFMLRVEQVTKILSYYNQGLMTEA